MYLLSTVNENILHSSYICDLNDIWHYRLGHASKKIINRMSHFNLIPKCKLNDSMKCEIYAQVKLTRKPFKFVTRNTSVLELIILMFVIIKNLKL